MSDTILIAFIGAFIPTILLPIINYFLKRAERSAEGQEAAERARLAKREELGKERDRYQELYLRARTLLAQKGIEFDEETK